MSRVYEDKTLFGSYGDGNGFKSGSGAGYSDYSGFGDGVFCRDSGYGDGDGFGRGFGNCTGGDLNE